MKRNSDMLSTQFNFTLIEVGNKHFVCSGAYRAIATKVMTSAIVLCLQTENEICRQRWELSMSTRIILDLIWSKTLRNLFH